LGGGLYTPVVRDMSWVILDRFHTGTRIMEFSVVSQERIRT
jgi:hypothetical protein